MKSKILSVLPFFAVISIAVPGHAAIKSAQVQAVMEKTVDEVILPGYQDFSKKASAMTVAMKTLCDENSQIALDNARAAFHELVHSWSVAEVLRDGPVIRENRFERIFFYPDRKSIGLKQVQALLAKKDEAAIDVESMAGKSVALQGIGTEEYILFGTGANDLAGGTENYRCRAGLAIATNLENLAGELERLWNDPNGVQKDWKRPGPENAVYRDDLEAVSGLLGVLVHGVETVRDKRIGVFYEPEDDYQNAKKAPLWRSGNTFASIVGNLEGLQAYWLNSGMQNLIAGDASALTANINFEFKTAIATAKSLKRPVADVLGDDESRRKFDFLILTLDDLLDRLNNDYGRVMGLGASFTFSDGD